MVIWQKENAGMKYKDQEFRFKKVIGREELDVFSR